MTIDDQMRDEKLQYDINGEAAKLSTLSSGKINKYEYLTGEKTLASNQKQIMELAKFTYSPLRKSFERQIKTIKDQGEEQTKTVKEQGEKQTKAIKSNKGVDNESRKIFDKIFYEKISEIKELTRQSDLNNLTYYFKNKSISPVNFIDLKAPLHLYRDIFDRSIKLAKGEEDQKKFKLDLNEVIKRNPKKKSEHRVKTIENIKNFYKLKEQVIIKLYSDYAKIRSEAKHRSK